MRPVGRMLATAVLVDRQLNHGWPAGCFDCSCGERRLYVAPLDF